MNANGRGETDDVRDALGRFLDAPLRGISPAEFSTGNLEAFMRVADNLAPRIAGPGEVVVRTMSVDGIEDDRATVSLDATRTIVIKNVTVEELTGPVTLRCIAGVWKVESIFLDGREMEAYVFDPPPSCTALGLHCEVPAVELLGRYSLVIVKAANLGDDEVVLDKMEFKSGFKTLLRRGVLDQREWPSGMGRGVVRPGATKSFLLMFAPVAERVKRVQLSMSAMRKLDRGRASLVIPIDTHGCR